MLETLTRWLPRRSSSTREVKAVTGSFLTVNGLSSARWSPRDYSAFAREGMMRNAVVYRSVRMISEAAASVPLLAYQQGNEVDEHPLLDLVLRPDGGGTAGGAVFLESLYGYLLVAGNAYIDTLVAGGQITGLHALRPDRVRVLAGSDGWPEAFEYSVGSDKSILRGDAVPGVPRVLHMKLFHPANDHYGLSPLEAAATSVDIHNTASRWNKALLENAARPSGALIYSSGRAAHGGTV